MGLSKARMPVHVMLMRRQRQLHMPEQMHTVDQSRARISLHGRSCADHRPHFIAQTMHNTHRGHEQSTHFNACNAHVQTIVRTSYPKTNAHSGPEPSPHVQRLCCPCANHCKHCIVLGEVHVEGKAPHRMGPEQARISNACDARAQTNVYSAWS